MTAPILPPTDLPLTFIKMHGLGNDYVYIDCFEREIANPEALSRFVADRHFGVGGDGLVLIMPSATADCRMRMFNADGSEAEMCGNAIRCVGKYVYESGRIRRELLRVETKAGIKELTLALAGDVVESVTVAMGRPIVEPARVPVNAALFEEGQCIVRRGEERYQFHCVSMGNPHAVCFVPEITDELVLGLGPEVERHPLFPARVNVEFVKVVSSTHLQMRVWERGSGETWACGTGACAVAVAASRAGLAGRQVTVSLRGGDLRIDWREGDDEVLMTGPATIVFTGTLHRG